MEEDAVDDVEPPGKAGLVVGCIGAPLEDDVVMDGRIEVLLEDEEDEEEEVEDMLDELKRPDEVDEDDEVPMVKTQLVNKDVFAKPYSAFIIDHVFFFPSTATQEDKGSYLYSIPTQLCRAEQPKRR